MPRFDPSVLTPGPEERTRLLDLLESGLDGVDPQRLTSDALAVRNGEPAVVVAIGKAAAGMARGAAEVLDVIDGLCVSDHEEPVPSTMRFMLGDHPVPGSRSLRAAEALLRTVSDVPSDTSVVALVSGGGSSLCELPRPAVPLEYLAMVNRKLVDAGAAIGEINLVRGHLSAIKFGGLARAAGRPIDTLVISDVAGGDPGLVASGPTIPHRSEPSKALDVMREASIDVPTDVFEAMSETTPSQPAPRVTLLADGFDALRAIARSAGPTTTIRSEWLSGRLDSCLEAFVAAAGPGITIGVGEPSVEVSGDGVGGRNTHAALLAATMLEGSDDLFAAFATDGVDGPSGSAGAIADGSTLTRGGDPTPAIDGFDSASYLARTSDLLICGPTGTNVSDIWILWRRAST